MYQATALLVSIRGYFRVLPGDNYFFHFKYKLYRKKFALTSNQSWQPEYDAGKCDQHDDGNHIGNKKR